MAKLPMKDLFCDANPVLPGVYLLKGYADSSLLLPHLMAIVDAAPLRQMETGRGFKMSVSQTNCGQVGWVSDRRGYRYEADDPLTGRPWPEMPEAFSRLASKAAAEAEFADFYPDACLINRYSPGTQMGAHRDTDEQDFSQPIVSVSLGIPARFYIIGAERRGHSTAMDLEDGDVVVFGGLARRYYHGVRKLKARTDSQFGAYRWNLTFRRAL